MEPGEARAGRVVLEFARAVVAGDFEAAHHLLAPSLQVTVSPAQLEQELERMLSIYPGRRPTTVELVMTDPMLSWSSKLPADIGWAHAAIAGENWSEAVSGIVESEGARDSLREIEWGRP